MRQHISLLLAALAILGLTASCGRYEKKTNTPTSGTSTLFCDDSFENIMEQEIDVFEYIYPDAHVLARYGTEAEAIDSLLSINTRTIVIPRELTDAETSVLKKKNRTPRCAKVAVDAVALIVNQDNPAQFLSKKEISEILSGETTNWEDLNPHFPNKPIVVLFDNDGSSMMKYMRDSLLDGRSLGPTAQKTGSIAGVVEAVRKNKYAIGVIGVSWLSTDLRKTHSIDDLASEMQNDSTALSMDDINSRVDEAGVKTLGVMRSDDRTAYRPFQENIYNGSYPLTRSIYMITISPSGSPGAGFYSFVTGFTGQKLIMKTGVMPARMNINIVELVP
ncbi:MAG: substrate-binding domain-containing protein [Bacteroidales bacterium]|nr:substrate-binding domain-containing protein [Bacteroidales bacterium]